MGKGEETRSAVLDVAARQARTVGLRGLTIGSLASATDLSKSGLFGHFRSKEALQLAVLLTERDRFVDTVVRPTLQAPRGEPRLRELIERWLAWGSQPGGCLFVAASTELDDDGNPAREQLVRDERDWLDTVAQVARGAVTEGHLAADVDVEQLAWEIHSIMLGFHHAHRLLRDPQAPDRARRGVEAVLDRARPH
jgi:AcrR family transcriptional regulator